MNELDLLAMDDFELFEEMNKAEKQYDRLRNEFRSRGLHKIPYCEYSHQALGLPNIPGLKEWLDGRNKR